MKKLGFLVADSFSILFNHRSFQTPAVKPEFLVFWKDGEVSPRGFPGLSHTAIFEAHPSSWISPVLCFHLPVPLWYLFLSHSHSQVAKWGGVDQQVLIE